MAAHSPFRWLVPGVLGLGMIVVVVLAVVAGLGTSVPAQSNCLYGVCQSNAPSPVLWESIIGVVVAVLLALLIGFLLLRRRRRPPPAGPPAAWAGTPDSGPMPGGGAVEAAVPAGATLAAPAYLESPEDVGSPPPETPEGIPPGSPPAGGEGDIDSLMQELDRISSEILKKGPPKTGGGSDSSGGSN